MQNIPEEARANMQPSIFQVLRIMAISHLNKEAPAFTGRTYAEAEEYIKQYEPKQNDKAE